jgi:hypothetical protein
VPTFPQKLMPVALPPGVSSSLEHLALRFEALNHSRARVLRTTQFVRLTWTDVTV